MAYYAHQTYCLLEDTGFVEDDIYVWVSPASKKITLRSGVKRVILIQVRGRELTYDRMIEWDQTRDFKTLKSGGLKFWENFKVPLASYIRYERKLKNRISDLLEKYVSNKYYKNYGFLFIGHGEGGALATYAALDFWQNIRGKIKSSQLEVITFGAPRIGDEGFVRSISKIFRINRVTYSNDFVPLFLSHTFRHPNTEYWIGGELCDCDVLANQPQPYPVIYDCYMYSGTENPFCNLAFQKPALEGMLDLSSEIFGSHLDAHNGPYFGYIMKQCRSRYEKYFFFFDNDIDF
ncbi:hypothetical protein G9A89_010427 [Geosiphon pyriformis]|nr:hypothetical protein G9A89_010427 [Geosiphon pyriformis]